MARFERTFSMEEPPREAQARLLGELGSAFHRLGFKLRDEEPGHLNFSARFLGPRVIVLWSAGFLWLLFWLWRKVMNHRVEVDFDSDGDGTKVTMYGRTGGGIIDMIESLGRRGHWPTSMDDRDWVPTPSEDQFAEWDDEDAPAPEEMDRITRKALRKAGRLP